MDLQTLIERRRGARSLQRLADDSDLAKQTWATHATPRPERGRRIPAGRTIRGIAKGLDVDPWVVGLATLETIGILDGDGTPELVMMLPPRDVLDRLSLEDMDTVVKLIRLLAAGHAGPARDAALEAGEGVAARGPGRPRTGGVTARVEYGQPDLGVVVGS